MEQTPEKIAIMVCRNTARSCTGAGCFTAFYERKAAFADYPEGTVLAAYFDCSGCDAREKDDPDFTKKLEKLRALGVGRVHLASCCVKHCEHLPAIRSALEEKGIPYVAETH